MKRVTVVIMCVLLLVTFAACTGTSFMSAAKVNRAVKEFGTPQAQLTLNFNSNSKKMKFVITYDLLLDKAPISVINFINLVENTDFYKDAILDSYDSTYHYYTAARYSYREVTQEDGKTTKKGYENNSGITMVGEFKSNNYSEPKSGYEQFSMFSLAMYYSGKADDFNSANGALIMSTSKTDTLNANNYAVFARAVSVTIYEGDEDAEPKTFPADRMSSAYLDQMVKQSTTTNCTMLLAGGDSKSQQVLGTTGVPRFVFSIEMLGDKDWSKLPKVK